MDEAGKVMASVAAQLMNGEVVVLKGQELEGHKLDGHKLDLHKNDQRIQVRRVGSGRLRMVQFHIKGRSFEAIEQNPDKPSPWGKLARERHQVVQFRDLASHKYIAVSVDGEVREYGKR